MKTIQISTALSHKYLGSGYVLAGMLDGEIVDFIYLSEIDDSFAGCIDDAVRLLDDPKIEGAVRKMQMRGDVVVGMLSAWEFTAL